MSVASDRKRRAGPVGRARLSPTLAKRAMGDPNVYRNANLLATNRRTSPGVLDLDLQVGGSLTVNQQMQAIEDKVNEITAALRAGGLMENSPG